MATPSVSARRYRIVVHGECGALLASAIEGVDVESSNAGNTCVVTSVRDDSELWGLLDRLQDLAMRIISLNEVGGERAAEDRVDPHR